MNQRTILITGGNGYVGKQIVAALAGRAKMVLSSDVRATPDQERLSGVTYIQSDIRDKNLAEEFRKFEINTVVHLASIVTPGKKSNREFEYSVDVDGTRNVLEACIATGVKQIVVSSSGAAYGYHADNPAWLKESDPIRGNQEMPYSWHKRLVEEMLSDYRVKHPQLKQTIFRIGTVLGKTVNNQITSLFEKPRMIGIRGSDSPFVFIWDHDLVSIFLQAIETQREGIYNVAGSGALSIQEIAARLGKPVLKLPAGLVRNAIRVLRVLGLTQYTPDQTKFIQYRPVLDNTKLRESFGYVPKKTSAEVFELWMETHDYPKGNAQSKTTRP